MLVRLPFPQESPCVNRIHLSIESGIIGICEDRLGGFLRKYVSKTSSLISWLIVCFEQHGLACMFDAFIKGNHY